MYDKSDAVASNSNMRQNITSVTPIYSFVFNFERKFSPEKARAWMDSNWTNGFYFCGIYLLLVFSLKHYMKNRDRFNLRKILITWNTMLAVFSFVGSARTLPEMLHVISNYGLYHSVCIPRYVWNMVSEYSFIPLLSIRLLVLAPKSWSCITNVYACTHYYNTMFHVPKLC